MPKIRDTVEAVYSQLRDTLVSMHYAPGSENTEPIWT